MRLSRSLLVFISFPLASLPAGAQVSCPSNCNRIGYEARAECRNIGEADAKQGCLAQADQKAAECYRECSKAKGWVLPNVIEPPKN
jgi:hypothetical protein